MNDILRYLVLGIGPGGAYALLAIGIVLVYRGSGVVNFGAGGFALIGSAVYYQMRLDNIATVWAIIAAVLATAVLGVVVEVLILHPTRHASPLTRVVATLGVAAAAQSGIQAHYGSQTLFVPNFLPANAIKVGSVFVGTNQLYVLGVAVVLTGVLWAVYRFTNFGIATTAVAENPCATASLGWSPSRIAVINWALGGALSGAAGVLLVPILGFSPTTFTLLIVPALAVAVLASFRSFPVALLGGLAIGVLESEGTLVQTQHPNTVLGFIPTFGLADVVPFVVIIVVLIIRGQSLPLRGSLTDSLPRLGKGFPRWKTLVIVFALCCASLWIFTASWVAAVTLSATVAIIGISIVVITGYAGQLSLAQFAFAGIGALVSSRLAAIFHTTFLLAGCCGIAVTIVVGLLVALPAVRVRGVNLAVVTMGLAVVINSAVLSNTNWNGGLIQGTVVPNPTIFGIDVQSVQNPRLWCITCLVALLVAGLIVSNLRRGRSGRRLIAVRDNERAAASVGVDVVTAKLYAFAIAAGLAGVGGVLLAFQNSNVDFSQFAPFASIQIVLLVVIGSVGYVVGGVLGGVAVVAGVAQEILGDKWAVGGWFQFFLAMLFLVAIVAHSDGFVAFFSESVLPKIEHLIANVRHRESVPHRESIEFASDEGTVTVQPAVPKTLEVRNLEVQFGGVKAVQGVSFKVEPGEVFGIIGPNGAGKTTIVDALSGFLPRYRGHVLLSDVSIDNLKAAQRAKAGITRSFQSLELFEDLSVAENLGVAADEDRRRVLLADLVFPRRQNLTVAAAAAVREFNLKDVLDKRPVELPYAQRRAVAIAWAVAAAPSVLLLDEPAAGLDITARRELEVLIRRLADQWNMAVVLIEHDVAMVMRTCDRVMALDFGRELALGTPEEVGSNQAVVTSYLGVDLQGRADQTPEVSAV